MLYREPSLLICADIFILPLNHHSNFIFIFYFKDAIIEREKQKQKDYEDRLKLEKEILDATEENAKLVAKTLQERQKLRVDIEKVCEIQD